MGTQKNHLNEMVLLSIQNIMIKFTDKKIFTNVRYFVLFILTYVTCSVTEWVTPGLPRMDLC